LDDLKGLYQALEDDEMVKTAELIRLNNCLDKLSDENKSLKDKIKETEDARE